MEINPIDEGVPSQEEIEKEEINSQKAPEIRVRAKPPLLTYALIAINILVWIVLYIISFISGDSYNNLLVTYGAKINVLILQGEFWRFLTPILLHSGIMHLVANSYSLYYLGAQTEMLYGHKRFAVIYLFSGFMGSIASFAFSTSTSVGASGAIFGLMGALLYFIFRKPILLQSSIGTNLIVVTVLNLVLGFTKDGIDYHAHIGGLIGGFLIAGTFYIAEGKAWQRWLSGIRAFALAVCIAVGGLLYGFNCAMNRVFPMLEDLKAYSDAGKWAEAEKTAEDILAQGYYDAGIRAETLWGLAVSEAMQGKWEEGVEHASQLIDVEPESGHYLLGVLYFYKEEYKLARQELLLSKKAGNSYEKMIDSLIAEIDGK